MRHIFIVNPNAGSRREQAELIESIRLAAHGSDYEIFNEYGVMRVREFIAWRLRDCVPTRFYACGGDGTLNLVLNCISDSPDAELATVPIGTGNDFARYIACDSGIAELMSAPTYKIDSIECLTDGGVLTQAINMVNIGLDGDVAARANRLKLHPLFGGKLAFISGLVAAFLSKFGRTFKISVDGGECLENKLALVAIANGSFCGGGFNAAPDALLDDGVLELTRVPVPSRIKFLRLVKDYKTGEHSRSALAREYILHTSCTRVEIAAEDKFNLCVDGEIIAARSVSIRVLAGKIKFVFTRSPATLGRRERQYITESLG